MTTRTIFLIVLSLLLLNVTPFFPLDAMLVLVIVYSLDASELQSLTFSFAAGILNDMTLPETKLLAPCYATLGALQSFTGRFIYRRNLLYIFLFVAAATLLKTVCLFALMNAPVTLHEIKYIFPAFLKETTANLAITPLYYKLVPQKQVH